MQAFHRRTELDKTIAALLEALNTDKPNWEAVEGAWVDALFEAAETDYEQSLRNTGVALATRDAEQLRAWLQLILYKSRDDLPAMS